MAAILDEQAIFEVARKIDTADAREAYLKQICGDDAAQLDRVRALLKAYEQSPSFLEAPAYASVDTVVESISEAAGSTIGPYKLVEQVGEGGMGTVWKAQQTEPVKRAVALKLIKAGMDSKQVIARFEAERQALALMDHPNIARVYDAGTAPDGRPFFVMEMVTGVPITTYCDEQRLTPRQRLELFVPVCLAIQHAHQKGVIHRDIKPSNILVALYDERPVPKVIDFGVAKATSQQLTEATLHTGFGTVVGTVEYMSPEQAGANPLDVDTRSDIYSLGVVLYELLTGSPPFSRTELEKAGILEMLRVIREQEPSRPSTKLSTADGLPTLAAKRGTEPAKLTKLVRGELDWIVMKALEKDRNRRYETANGFAMDVQRFLADEPVMACPPSVAYRLRKFVRRNKLILNAALVVVLALVVGTIISAWQAVRAENAYTAAVAQRRLAEENLRKAREAVHDYFTLVSQSPQLDSPALQPLRKALLERALVYYREFLQQAVDDPALQMEIAATYFRAAGIYLTLGRVDDAVDALEQGAKAAQAPSHAGPGQAAEFQRLSGLQKHLGFMHRNAEMRGDPARARAVLENVAALWEKLAREYPADPGFQTDLALLNHFMGDLLVSSKQHKAGLVYLEKAELEWRRLIEQFSEVAEYRANLAQTVYRMGSALRALGHPDKADQAIEAAQALREKLVAAAPTSTRYRSELAHSLVMRGNRLAGTRGAAAEAEKNFRRAIELGDALVVEAPGVPYVVEMLAHAHDGIGRLRSADAKYAEAADSHRLAASLFRSMIGNAKYDQIIRMYWSRSLNSCAMALELLVASEQRNGEPTKVMAAYHEALVVYGHLLTGFPDQEFETRRSLAEFHVKLEKWDKANDEFSKTIELKPDRWEGWSGRGRALLALKRWQESIHDYSKAIELAPAVHTNWHHRGIAYIQLRQWDNVLFDYTNLLDRFPKDANAWYSCGIAHAQLKQTDEAIADLRKAIALGWRNLGQMKNDPNLAPLRTHQDFQKLIDEVEKKTQKK